MIAWAIVLLVFLIVGMIRVGIHLGYEERTLRLELLISKLRFVLIGQESKNKNRKKKSKQEKTQNQKQKTKTKENASHTKKGNLLENPWIQALMDYWRDILALVGRVLKTPTLDVLRIQLWVGGGDSEKCAMTYGRICAVLGAVLPVVENTFGIKKRQIEVSCCYDRDRIDVSAEIAITVRVYEVFVLVFALLGLGIRILIQARKYKKAVQNT